MKTEGCKFCRSTQGNPHIIETPNGNIEIFKIYGCEFSIGSRDINKEAFYDFDYCPMCGKKLFTQ